MNQTTRASAAPADAAATSNDESTGIPTAFNLITEGVGYLNRVRLVKPAKGPAYLACTLKALMGKLDAVEYMPIDCIVVGALARQIVGTLEMELRAERRVIVGFRVGDSRPDRYQVRDRETGELKDVEGLKARLLQITFAKVNGASVEIPLVQRGQADASAADDVAGANAGAAADANRRPAPQAARVATHG